MADVDLDSLTDEPSVLAAAARTHLREVFLRARVAVSGANFGVAETGTLTVVESEGNGRMCLTLPETLITVMGIEKVVPTWRDLEVFLQLLPRSSTGERMNPYTSTWTGVTPGDGPQEVHLVLLDNGRTRALADDLGRTALHCIRCSACLNVCPVYERTGGHAYGSVYPGPIGAVLTPFLTGVTGGDDPNDSLPYASSLCGACYDVCPVKINIPDLLVELRAEHTEAHAATHRLPSPEAAAMAAAAWVMGDATRFARAGRAATTARHGIRRGRPLLPLPPPAERVDRLARRPEPTRRDVPRLVDAHPRGALVSARDEVLARIRGALGDAPGAAPTVPRAYRRTGEHAPGSARVVEQLVDRLEDYRATVVRSAADDESVGAAIASRSRGRRRHAPRSPHQGSPTRGRRPHPGAAATTAAPPRATWTSSTRS